MKKLAFPLACVLTVASAQAANIVWVSFHPGENQPSVNAAAAGFTTAPDAGYTQALTAAGHNVTRVVTSGTPNAAQLNAADLVIISRSVPSGDYQDPPETAAWNTSITAPTMILGGYIVRQNRLGYVTASNIPDTTNPVTLQAVQPSHPIFSGITLGAGNTLSYAVPVTYTNSLQRGISTLTDPLAGGGTLIATVDPAGQTTAANGLLIAEWPAGATMADTAPNDILGGRRMVFLTGSRENIITSEGSGMYDLTPEGRQLFLNAVSYMAVPEPSTYALLGLGGMALLLRRRKA
jgi:hypothetical protein